MRWPEEPQHKLEVPETDCHNLRKGFTSLLDVSKTGKMCQERRARPAAPDTWPVLYLLSQALPCSGDTRPSSPGPPPHVPAALHWLQWWSL